MLDTLGFLLRCSPSMYNSEAKLSIYVTTLYRYMYVKPGYDFLLHLHKNVMQNLTCVGCIIRDVPPINNRRVSSRFD